MKIQLFSQNSTGGRLSRRRFLFKSAYATAAFASCFAVSSCKQEQQEKDISSRYRHRKALIVDRPDKGVLAKVRDAGFGGVEAGIVSPAEAAKARKVAEDLGIRIHSVMRGWAKFNSTDRDEVQKSLAVTVDALYAAEAYGADDILLVPGRIDVLPMPEPWEFSIRFDEKTGHLISAAEGQNNRYEEYIAAHNRAFDAFQAAIRSLIPRAEKTGIVIAIENVWNNLFVDAAHMACFIDSFESRWVRAYFDIGNHVKYSRPEHWISVLGKRIFKCHVKDFRLNRDGHGGKFVNIGEGSVNWPGVMKALKDVGYDGWMTVEGSDKISMAERSRRLERIIAGEQIARVGVQA